jgi:hypothetical protein
MSAVFSARAKNRSFASALKRSSGIDGCQILKAQGVMKTPVTHEFTGFAPGKGVETGEEILITLGA